MSYKGQSATLSTLNRLIFLVVVIVLGIVVVGIIFSSNNPFAKEQPKPAPISIGLIQKQYKMETAEVASQTIIEGSTNNALPFSTEKYTYQVFVTMTAGIDMSEIKDSDITVSGETATVKLPAPKLLRTESNGKVIAYSGEALAGLSKNKNLVDLIQEEGKTRIVKTVLEQGKLMQEARLNAEDNLRGLILQLGYKNVVFVQDDFKGTPTPVITSPPR